MLRNILKKWLTLVLAFVMISSIMPQNVVFAASSGNASTMAHSGTLDDTSIEVSITNEGNVSLAGTTIDADVTGSGGCNAANKSATLTIKNNKTEAAILSFVYEPTPNGGSVKLNGTNVNAKDNFSQKIAAGGTVTFVLTSAKDAKTTSIKITEIKLIVEKDVTTTFKPGENGTFTVDGEKIGEETSKTQSSTQAYAMAATPASGYKFFGWKSETTGKYVSNTANASLMLDSDQTIYPVFIDKDTALFSTNGSMFFDLNEAVKAAASDKNKRIVLAATGTLAAGDYNIPSGYTLLIPFDAAGTCYTTAPGVLSNSYTTPSAFRTLTMAEGTNIIVSGAISVSAKQTSGPGGGSYAGAPSGPYGYIKMSEGSTITCKNGAKLYAWGYISGDGKVTMKSGSTVYEDMQIGDFRGGSASSSLVSKARGKAFLFNQYFIQNVEALMEIEAGATEKLYTSLYASSMTASSDATFIGPNGMFNITNGSFTKKYNSKTDRLEVSVNGEATIDSITVKVMSNSLDSGNYVLPITNNMTLDIQSGTTHLTQDIAMLAGVKVSVANGATIDIASNSDIFLFDHDEWAGKNFAQYEFRSVSYSPTKSYTRKSSDLTDVKLDVNGTVDVNGHLYTTAGGADICSSKGTGTINMISGAGTATQTYQVANAESDVTAVPITSAKLHNGCNDPAYTETAGAEAGTIYKYNKNKDMWEIPGSEITITFDANANEGEGTMEAITSESGSEVIIPKNKFTREGYTFKNWATNADGTGTVYEVGETATFNDNTTLYAQWEKDDSEFTVTWVDEDGTELLVETYKEGEIPSYNGKTPSKDSDAQYTYEFAGWTPEVTAVFGDVTYKATYTGTLRSYTITWLDENGEQLAQTTVDYGETPVYPNAEPTKEATEDTTYHFAGWKNGEGGIVPVIGDATYQVTFESAVRTYTITWDIDGQIETAVYEYGAMPSHDVPSKEATAQYEYTFKGWAPEISAVKGDQTYTANFDEALRKYAVTWLNADGTEILSETVDYETMAVYSGETPTKGEDEDYTYEFAGWSPEPDVVTGDVTYTAQFNAIEKIKTYTITWMSDDRETVLRTDVVEAGQMPAYGDNNPVKQGTAQYSYTFTGWDKEVVVAEADATYTAVFEETINKYTIKFMNGDTVLQESEVEYGQMPEYTGATPSKTGDAQFSYTFAGWDKEIAEVTEDAVYSATFDVNTNTYTVTWINYDETVLETDEEVEYGITPSYDGETPVQDGYEFIGWDPAVTPVGANITYTAQFEKITDIIFQAKNPHTDEVITLENAEVEKGLVLAQPTAPSFIGYEFTGWNVAVGDENENVDMALDEVDLDELNEVIAGMVTEDTEKVIITANYEKVTDTYTIKLEYVIDKTHVDAYTAEPREVGTSVNLSASEIYTDENGEKYVFDHWLINGKEYGSPSVTVTPKSGGKYTILAYYVDGDSKVVEPSVEFMDAYAEVVNGTNKMGLQMSYHVPEGFTYESAGFVYSTKVMKPEIGNGTKSATKLTTPDGSYTLHISIGTKVDTLVYARAYLTYTNSNGETVTIYTDTNSYTWNRLNN